MISSMASGLLHAAGPIEVDFEAQAAASPAISAAKNEGELAMPMSHDRTSHLGGQLDLRLDQLCRERIADLEPWGAGPRPRRVLDAASTVAPPMPSRPVVAP